jgi:hypothetical protein
VLVAGYPDVGVPRPFGCAFKEMEMSISFGQAIAASGMAAAIYTTREPATDIDDVIAFLGHESESLGVDAGRVGLWAMSGNVPVAIAALMRGNPAIKALALSCGFTLDTGGSTVADAARTYRFVNAAAGKTVGDLPPDVPLFIARAGRDQFPGLNDTLDRFLSDAVARNLPVTFVNHATALHGFELDDDSETSRAIIRQMIAFMRFSLEP